MKTKENIRKIALMAIMLLLCIVTIVIVGAQFSIHNGYAVQNIETKYYEDERIFVDMKLDDGGFGWCPVTYERNRAEQEALARADSNLFEMQSASSRYGEMIRLHPAPHLPDAPTVGRITIKLIADRYMYNQQAIFFNDAQNIASHIVNSHPIYYFAPWIHIYAIGTISPAQNISIITGDGSDGSNPFQITIPRTSPFVQQHFPNVTSPSPADNHYWLIVQRGALTAWARQVSGLALTWPSPSVALHEMGHLWGLRDEYCTPNRHYLSYENGPNIRSNVNLANPLDGTLSYLSAQNTAIPSSWGLFIGSFPGANNQWSGFGGIGIYPMDTFGWGNTIWYRPSQQCIMNLPWDNIFCLVCAEHLVRWFAEGREDSTRIRSYAYAGSCKYSITISDYVTSIGQYAFIGAANLHTIINHAVTPQNLRNANGTLNELIFAGFPNINSLTVVIPFGTFAVYYLAGWGGFNLVEASPNGLIRQGNTVTGFNAPANFNGHIQIPHGVTAIGNSALTNPNIRSVILPATLTTIGAYAFANSGITSMFIPRNAITVNSNAFNGIANLAAISVSPNNQSFASQNGILYNNSLTQFIHIPARLSGHIRILDSITEIPNFAFTNRVGITGIDLHNGLTSIGDSAFMNTGITSVQLPFSVTSIGSNAFSGTNAMIYIASNATSIPNYLFYGTGASRVTIPTSIVSRTSSIAPKAFDAYTTVYIAERSNIIAERLFEGTIVRRIVFTQCIFNNWNLSIGFNAFATSNEETTVYIVLVGVSVIRNSHFANTGLRNVVIAEGVVTIEDRAFENNAIRSVIIPDSVTHIGSWAFSNNNLESIIIPNSVTHIGIHAFENNNLESVTLSNNITRINGWVFRNNNLQSIIIPYGVMEIGGWAFTGNNLESITVSSSVTQIDGFAFSNNFNLSTVTIEQTVGNPILLGLQAFNGTNIERIYFSNWNMMYAYRQDPNWRAAFTVSGVFRDYIFIGPTCSCVSFFITELLVDHWLMRVGDGFTVQNMWIPLKIRLDTNGNNFLGSGYIFMSINDSEWVMLANGTIEELSEGFLFWMFNLLFDFIDIDNIEEPLEIRFKVVGSTNRGDFEFIRSINFVYSSPSSSFVAEVLINGSSFSVCDGVVMWDLYASVVIRLANPWFEFGGGGGIYMSVNDSEWLYLTGGTANTLLYGFHFSSFRELFALVGVYDFEQKHLIKFRIVGGSSYGNFNLVRTIYFCQASNYSTLPFDVNIILRINGEEVEDGFVLNCLNSSVFIQLYSSEHFSSGGSGISVNISSGEWIHVASGSSLIVSEGFYISSLWDLVGNNTYYLMQSQQIKIRISGGNSLGAFAITRIIYFCPVG
ncbi:MAG: leucine-rich repeat protein [Defluviitaleaceae bacterium]|nr:leucine-rich repeat protein [Defluviitaleaceae bacterium]